MNVGIITTWYERGASYVSKTYEQLLSKENKVYIYARDGKYIKNDKIWSGKNVTWGWRLYSSDIHFPHLKRWINKNNIEKILFNEQRDFEIILKIKKHFSNIEIGCYIDYYTQEMIPKFRYYDFLICNTKRHYSVFKDITTCYYLPWGANTKLFTPNKREQHEKIVFFHSAGMSMRKGTKALVDTFINYDMKQTSQLIIHSQIKIEKIVNYTKEQLIDYGIEVVDKTVGAPGLYFLGDVYVYPTTLDGLGLTIYEALASGMPVVTTNCAPMNEIVDDNIGKLVDVDKLYVREDAYYWPLSDVNCLSLYQAMQYYVNHIDELDAFQKKARNYALKNLDIESREKMLNDIFSGKRSNNYQDFNVDLNLLRRERKNKLLVQAFPLMPDFLESGIIKYLEKKKADNT